MKREECFSLSLSFKPWRNERRPSLKKATYSLLFRPFHIVVLLRASHHILLLWQCLTLPSTPNQWPLQGKALPRFLYALTSVYSSAPCSYI
jgi:hypothetical protein